MLESMLQLGGDPVTPPVTAKLVGIADALQDEYDVDAIFFSLALAVYQLEIELKKHTVENLKRETENIELSTQLKNCTFNCWKQGFRCI